jgi:menaquinone-dependent protoporphyrinogen IX oxidase
MIRNVIVYYTRDGATRMISDALHQMLRCDCFGITEPRSRTGTLAYLGSVIENIRKIFPPINPIDHDPSQYDRVIIGTPTWSMIAAGPVRTYLRDNAAKFKQVAFFCTKASTPSKRLFDDMAFLAQKLPIMTLAIKRSQIFTGKHTNLVLPFIDRLKLP